MSSLSQLNSFGQSSLTYTDLRPALIKFDRNPAQNQIKNISQNQTHTALTGVEITELIKGEEFDITYQIDVSAFNTPTVATVTWNSIPSGLTVQNPQPGIYSIGPITTVAQWQQVRNPTITLPADWLDIESYTSVILDGSTELRTWNVEVNIVNQITTALDFNISMTPYIDYSGAALSQLNYSTDQAILGYVYSDNPAFSMMTTFVNSQGSIIADMNSQSAMTSEQNLYELERILGISATGPITGNLERYIPTMNRVVAGNSAINFTFTPTTYYQDIRLQYTIDQPNANFTGIKFSSDGLYLFGLDKTLNYLRIYKRSGSFYLGLTFIPSVISPSSSLNGIQTFAISDNGRYIATRDTSANLKIYYGASENWSLQQTITGPFHSNIHMDISGSWAIGQIGTNSNTDNFKIYNRTSNTWNLHSEITRAQVTSDAGFSFLTFDFGSYISNQGDYVIIPVEGITLQGQSGQKVIIYYKNNNVYEFQSSQSGDWQDSRIYIDMEPTATRMIVSTKSYSRSGTTWTLNNPFSDLTTFDSPNPYATVTKIADNFSYLHSNFATTVNGITLAGALRLQPTVGFPDTIYAESYPNYQGFGSQTDISADGNYFAGTLKLSGGATIPYNRIAIYRKF